MRLITFQDGDGAKLGAWVDADSTIVDLAAAARIAGLAAGPFESMMALIESGERGLDQARKVLVDPPIEALLVSQNCRILAPLPVPTQIRDCLTFEAHLLNSKRAIGEKLIAEAADPVAKRAELEQSGYFTIGESFYRYPVYYNANRMSVTGPDTDIVWPEYSHAIDFELEWAVVIGRRGEKVDVATAADLIFGYTIFNDWSARDEQMIAMGHAINLGPGAGKDFASSMGPCIVTADAIGDPRDKAMIVRINGVEKSRGNAGDSHFTFEQLIAHLTRGHALHPGEVIASGTVGGGCGVELGQMLDPGDVVELEVEGIGVLRNRVLALHMMEASPAG